YFTVGAGKYPKNPIRNPASTGNKCQSQSNYSRRAVALWKPNSIRPRVLLTLLGLLLMAGGAAVAWLSWDSSRNGLAQTRVIDSVPAQMPQLGLYVAAVLALISIMFIFMVLSALPKIPGKRTFVYRSDNDTSVSTMDSRTISLAAEEAAES